MSSGRSPRTPTGGRRRGPSRLAVIVVIAAAVAVGAGAVALADRSGAPGPLPTTGATAGTASGEASGGVSAGVSGGASGEAPGGAPGVGPVRAAGAGAPRAVDERGCGWFLAYEPGLLRVFDRSPAVGDLDPEQRRLLRAAVLGDVDGIRAALAAGSPADVVAPGFPYTPLTVSVSSQCPAAVDLLLEAGADPDLRLPGEDPPLAVAVLVGDTASVTALLEAGADPAVATADGLALRELADILGRDEIDALLAGAAPPSVQS